MALVTDSRHAGLTLNRCPDCRTRSLPPTSASSVNTGPVLHQSNTNTSVGIDVIDIWTAPATSNTSSFVELASKNRCRHCILCVCVCERVSYITPPPPLVQVTSMAAIVFLLPLETPGLLISFHVLIKNILRVEMGGGAPASAFQLGAFTCTVMRGGLSLQHRIPSICTADALPPTIFLHPPPLLAVSLKSLLFLGYQLPVR